MKPGMSRGRKNTLENCGAFASLKNINFKLILFQR